jgi:hypothetical protein
MNRDKHSNACLSVSHATGNYLFTITTHDLLTDYTLALTRVKQLTICRFRVEIEIDVDKFGEPDAAQVKMPKGLPVDRTNYERLHGSPGVTN